MKFTWIVLGVVLSICSAGVDAKSKKSNKQKNIHQQLASLQVDVDVLKARIAPAHASILVDCDAGESLATALLTPAESLEISFTGSCYENLDIRRANLSLTGLLPAEIQGEVRIDSGGGTVQFESVYINNSQGSGLLVESHSRLKAVNLHVDGSTGVGILLVNGSLVCADCSSNNNGQDGLALSLSSNALLGGTQTFNGNGEVGIEIYDASSLRTAVDPPSIGAPGLANSIEMNNNSQFALLLYGSSASFITDNTHTTADLNSNGIAVTSGSTGHFMGPVDASNNGIAFLVLGGVSFIRGSITATDNNIGLFVSEHGTLRGEGTATTQNNNIGFFVRSSFAGIQSIVSDNNNSFAGLVQLGAVVRGTAQVTGTVACDGTEILASGFVCGAN